MPGFGQGPFGRDPFGRWPWSRQVLFDALPGLYRQQDTQNGGVLELWTESLRPSFDQALDRILHWGDLRDALKVRTQYNDTDVVRLGPLKEPDSPTEQRGVDASIDSLRSFTSETARFRPEDIGKTLVLSGSGVPINNRRFKIAQVISPTKVRCDPPLVVDPGPLRWFVKGFSSIPEGIIAVEVRGGSVDRIVPGWILSDGASQFTVVARKQFFPVRGEARALTELEGLTAVVLSDGRLQVEKPFTQADVGKKVTLLGSTQASNNGKFEVYKVDPANLMRVTTHEPLLVSGVDANGGVLYTLKLGVSGVTVQHLVTGISTPLSVVVRASLIIVNVATDGSGNAISTANAVAAAVTVSTFASPLVTAVVTGSGASVVGSLVETLIPGACLLEDGGPLVWARLPFPELRLAAGTPPLGVVEQEGVDLVVSGLVTNDVSSAIAKFTVSDVGKNLVIRGGLLGQDGKYPILAFVSSTTVQVSAPTTLSAGTNLYWEVRTISDVGDGTRAVVAAPSLIEHLSRDFAIEVDQNDTEARQRSWVENVTQWLDLKGTVKAYEIIGAISGFDVTPLALYRITQQVAAGIPEDHIFYLPDDIARSGSDGGLSVSGSRARLTCASAPFFHHDIGSLVRLSNASLVPNNALFEIIDFIDASTVEFDPAVPYTAPDYGVLGTALVPTLEWELRRIYTDRPPSRARFDDLNVELMQDIVGVSNFLMDSYCWETDFIEEFPIQITAVTGVVTGVPIYFTVEVTGVVAGVSFSTARVIGDPATFEITDANNVTYAVESLPVMTAPGPPEVHTFLVFGSDAPTLGLATMRYLCQTETVDCDFCKSAVVLARVEEGAIASEPNADISRAGDSVVSRLENEVKPGHVRLISHVESAVTDPHIYTVVPGNGMAGDIVVIWGEGFIGVTAVKFDGVVSVFTVDSDVHITATVPAGPPVTSVDVTVEK